MSKGICPRCYQERWLGGKGRICKPCAYPHGICEKCQRPSKIYVDNLCYLCYQHRQIDRKLDDLAIKFKPAEDYNRYLFDLYLRYIRRYRLAYFHLKQATALVKILSENPLPPLQGWDDILSLSHRHKLYHSNKKQNGCAFLKLGYMLQELGIIGPRRDERDYWIDAAVRNLPQSVKDDVAAYICRLKKLGAADATIENHLRFLRDFVFWLETVYPQLNIFSVTESKVIEYAEHLRTRSNAGKFLRDNILGIRRYYDWLVYSKKAHMNPCANLDPSRSQVKINICSDEQLAALMRYVTLKDADAEGAFLISLILFYGLSTDELSKAMIGSDPENITIIFERPKRTRGRHYYNRDQTLTLPKAPAWFFDLQQRFYKQRQVRYQASKMTFPCRRLLLPKSGLHTRPMSDTILIKRIYRATALATGRCIRPAVLRQTCGHIYSQHGDGSMLARLGWSKQFAFEYTWLPRKIEIGSVLPGT